MPPPVRRTRPVKPPVQRNVKRRAPRVAYADRVMRRLGIVAPLVVVISALAGCHQQPLGTTVGGETCLHDLHASPRSVHPGGQVTLRRAPGCDQGHAHQLTVSLAGRGRIGTATLDADGAVTGTVVVPEGTAPGSVDLLVHESNQCNDTASCSGHPTWTSITVR